MDFGRRCFWKNFQYEFLLNHFSFASQDEVFGHLALERTCSSENWIEVDAVGLSLFDWPPIGAMGIVPCWSGFLDLVSTPRASSGAS